MQKIRIGNDVRLNLTLRGPRTYDQANIKQLKCYLINTSMLDYFQVDCFCSKHVHGCGCVNDRCGHSKYHALPHCRYYDCCHNDFYHPNCCRDCFHHCSHDFHCISCICIIRVLQNILCILDKWKRLLYKRLAGRLPENRR